MKLLPAQIIKKKRDNLVLTKEELHQFLDSYLNQDIPDYQMSALLMAIYFNGMTQEETSAFTKIMKESGNSFDFQALHPHVVDKHSTGGVGDKASLILAPIVACCGVYVPMIAGRGLGHTGGTLDKLESIPGFNTQLTENDFLRIVKKHGFAIMGQTKNICPADKKLYSLRDVTATVESLPLICGSIMSKKLSEGIKGLVLDVKFGNGAFMKNKEDAKKLALLLKRTGEDNNVNVHALLTNMEQPLGQYVGNALEVKECYEILAGSKNKLYEDTKQLSLILSAHMILVGKKADSFEQALQMATQALESGAALEKFEQVSQAQGAQCKMNEIPQTSNVIEVKAQDSGYIKAFKNEDIGYLGIQLKAGRSIQSDKINPLTGFEFLAKVGNKVTQGDCIAKIYHDNESISEEFINKFKNCILIAESSSSPLTLIEKIIT